MLRLLLVIFILLLSSIASTPYGVAWYQPIEPLASTMVSGGRVELYAAIKAPKQPILFMGRKFLYPIREDLHYMEPTTKLGPWEDEKGWSNRESYVLGFLLRNEKGEVPSGHQCMITSYRATFEDNSTTQRWSPPPPISPYCEVYDFDWDFQLAPLSISVPKGFSQIKKLESAIATLPFEQAEFVLTDKDFSERKNVEKNGVVIIPVTTNQGIFGNSYEFVVAWTNKLDKRINTQGRTDAKLSVSIAISPTIEIVGNRRNGKKVSPNMQSFVMADKKAQHDFLAKLQSNPLSKELDVDAKTIAELLADPTLNLMKAKLGFTQEKAALESIQVSVREFVGIPTFQSFNLNNIPLEGTAAPDAISEFVSQLPMERTSINTVPPTGK